MTVGERIRALRKERNWSQKELHTRSGVAEITIRTYENTDRMPRVDQLQKIADALGVPLNHLLPQKSKEGAAQEGLLSILQMVYDSVEVNWHSTPCDGEPEYDGEYTVYLNKDKDDITLAKHQYEALLGMVNRELPSMIQQLLKIEDSTDE